MLLSLFSGAGGLDLGFEQAGFEIGLAYERRPAAVASYNQNLGNGQVARVRDVRELSPELLDLDFGGLFAPSGVIGGPPCQSYSRGNTKRDPMDTRGRLICDMVSLALALHRRSSLDFVIIENVPELKTADEGRLLAKEIGRLTRAGFNVRQVGANAVTFGVPQARERLFVIAINKAIQCREWAAPSGPCPVQTVRDAIGDLPEPATFTDVREGSVDLVHPNHWCMTPRSRRFSDGSLKPGYRRGRSFKTLVWDEPSITVSYGHREVHVHPNCRRRLSVYEAMLLQGFPKDYVLSGSLSDQFSQISEAVPPPLALAVAQGINEAIKLSVGPAVQEPQQNSQLPQGVHGF